jgi:hypothetical protein
MLSKRNAAIITAYTGRVIGDFNLARDYMDELMEVNPSVDPFGNPESVREASKEDFINIKVDSNDPEAMTEREAAVITAFTGIAIGDFGVAHLYIEEILERPVWTHELGTQLVWSQIKEKSKPDFIALHESVI